MKQKLFFSLIALFSMTSIMLSCSSNDPLNELGEVYIDNTSMSHDAFIDSLKKREPVVRIIYNHENSKTGIPYEITYPLKITYLNETDSRSVHSRSNSSGTIIRPETTITNEGNNWKKVTLRYKQISVCYLTQDLSKFPGPSEYYLYERIHYYPIADEYYGDPYLEWGKNQIKVRFSILNDNGSGILSFSHFYTVAFNIDNNGNFFI